MPDKKLIIMYDKNTEMPYLQFTHTIQMNKRFSMNKSRKIPSAMTTMFYNIFILLLIILVVFQLFCFRNFRSSNFFLITFFRCFFYTIPSIKYEIIHRLPSVYEIDVLTIEIYFQFGIDIAST